MLLKSHGPRQRARLERGLRQVGQFWRTEDGDGAAAEAFVRENFATDQKTLDTMFDRFSRMLEQLDGHTSEIRSQFRLQTDLDRGPVLPLDAIFAAYEPAAHVSDDFFANKLAFVVLLNFPLTTAQERLTEGRYWTRRQWAEARLAQRFSSRVPADVVQAISQAQAAGELYINQYNICAHHLLDAEGRRPFPREAPPAAALERSRRDQGPVFRRRRGAGQSEAAAAGLGTDRRSVDPRRGDQ